MLPCAVCTHGLNRHQKDSSNAFAKFIVCLFLAETIIKWHSENVQVAKCKSNINIRMAYVLTTHIDADSYTCQMNEEE